MTKAVTKMSKDHKKTKRAKAGVKVLPKDDGDDHKVTHDDIIKKHSIPLAKTPPKDDGDDHKMTKAEHKQKKHDEKHGK